MARQQAAGQAGSGDEPAGDPEVTRPAGDAVARAAEVLAQADAVLATAGAGLGVDSGLPDFRGDEGFWRAYPPYARLGLSFVQLANPAAFVRDPELAWGFYGHRRALYRRTVPHAGFAVLRDLAGFVFTSNVDGQFQAAGFAPDRILECHGSLWWEQCLAGCGAEPFPATDTDVEVDPDTMRAVPPLPACPSCGGLARPNVLLFGDGAWDGRRHDEQEVRLRRYLADTLGPGLVVLEVGAGTAVPTVRWFGGALVDRGARLIRINPRDHHVPAGQVAVPGGAAASLLAIRDALARS